MKLVRYNGGRIGVVIDGTVRDVTAAAGVDPAAWPPTGMIQLIADFDNKRAQLSAAAEGEKGIPLEKANLETPVPWPNKLIAIPVNYHAHAIEMSSPAISRNAGFFLKCASALSGASEPIILPDLPGREIHHEAELAVIIGRRGRNIPRKDALSYVFGYSCLIDVTVRGRQERTIRKSYDTFCPVGPWLITADEVGTPTDLQVSLWVNENLRQDANTKAMILSVAEIIEMCSTVSTLEPGDVIATGTGEGVGKIEAGDTLKINITRVGGMSLKVRQGEGGYNVAIPHKLPAKT